MGLMNGRDILQRPVGERTDRFLQRFAELGQRVIHPGRDGRRDDAADQAIAFKVAQGEGDTIVIGAPMYNFTIPSQLKAWIDRIAVAGKTFRYTENGPEGLVKGKRVIIALTRGGIYSEGSPARALEHLETYLRGLFNFVGIEPEFVIAEGLNLSLEHREQSVNFAVGETEKLAA